MSTVGQRERATQERVVKLFQEHLNYTYLGNWIDRNNNRNIEQGLLSQWLERQGIGQVLINKALRELDRAAALGEGINLYDANQAVYGLLRYGVKVREGAGQQSQAVWMINWRKPEKMILPLPKRSRCPGKTRNVPTLPATLPRNGSGSTWNWPKNHLSAWPISWFTKWSICWKGFTTIDSKR